MHSSVTKSFRTAYTRLPITVRSLARKKYRLWLRSPGHPSLHFKQAGDYWSVRIGLSHRALGREKDGVLYWFWIGHHREYDRLLNR